MSNQFEQMNLQPQILQAVMARGYDRPTPIQAQAIPVILAGKDVLGTAQTGTGKTAAFLLPILQRLNGGPRRRARVLIIAPTRELAEQIKQEADAFSGPSRIHSVAIYGGVGKGPQLSALRRGAEIIVACPGRLLDLMSEGGVDLSNIEVLVLDEADRMCDMGFLPDVKRILQHLPTNRQTLFFSATMPEDARQLADKILRDPVTIQIGIIAPAETVSHALYPVAQQEKKPLLLSWLGQTATGRVLIFTRTKHRAKKLAADLLKEGFRVGELQGNMSQNARQAAIDNFRRGKLDLLVATDVASRGIDVTDISHVVNFDMPDTADAYTHRIGRTGRADQTGEAITFFSEGDDAMLRDIEKVLGSKIERRRLADFEYGSFPAPRALVTNGHRPQNGRGPRQPDRSQAQNRSQVQNRSRTAYRQKDGAKSY